MAVAETSEASSTLPAPSSRVACASAAGTQAAASPGGIIRGASYSQRHHDVGSLLDKMGRARTDEERYEALFHLSHTITKAMAQRGNGKHAAVAEACADLPVVERFLEMYSDYALDEQVVPFVLSALTNIACVDTRLVTAHGGAQVLLRHLSPPAGVGSEGCADDDEASRELHARNQYYAVAGVFNLLEGAVAEGEGESPCVALVRTGSHMQALAMLSQSEREEVARYARLSLHHLRGPLEPQAPRAAVEAAAGTRSAAREAVTSSTKYEAPRGSVLSALVTWAIARVPARGSARSSLAASVLLFALALAVRRGSQLRRK